MPIRPTHYLAGSLALLAGLAAAPPAHAATVHLVNPGESVQAAVDAASAGDVVQLMPGTYHESVVISHSGLTLRGAGPATVLTPDPAQTGNACATAGHGVCVYGTDAQRLTGVEVSSLTVTGYRKNGLDASDTDGLQVMNVTARGNGQQGISQEKSVRATVVGNTATDNGQSGIFLANSVVNEGGAIDTEGTVIRANRLSGNRIGVTVRRARDLTVDTNDITGNCGGVFIVGDEGVPKAGALTISHNRVVENNKYCPATPRLAYIQGTGILLTGTEDTRVTDNQVGGNTGASPMSGGIVLFSSLVGTPNTRSTISHNVATRNGPADLADRDTGTGNTWTRNTCTVSEPAGRC